MGTRWVWNILLSQKEKKCTQKTMEHVTRTWEAAQRLPTGQIRYNWSTRTLSTIINSWKSNPYHCFKRHIRTSLVAQWLRIRLPMQGTRVWALVREDPTCRGATKPVCYNYWACALEPMSHNYWARMLQLLKPAHLESMLHNKRSHRNEKPVHHNEE